MKQNTEKENLQKIRKRILLSLAAIFLLIINGIYFYHKVSSNHALASHYTVKGDPMEKYRNPAVAGLYYPADTDELNKKTKTPKSPKEEKIDSSIYKCSICKNILKENNYITADKGKTLICKNCFNKLL